MTTWEAVLTIVGLAFISLFTRSFFLIPHREIPLPPWLQRGLRYAPLGALVAVAVPEIVMTGGEVIDTLLDARIAATVAATAYFFWRRDILGTILTGTSAMLACRLGLGW
jgi:branched-subunit amino acid transport protein